MNKQKKCDVTLDILLAIYDRLSEQYLNDDVYAEISIERIQHDLLVAINHLKT